MVLRMKVGLSPGNFVLDGDPREGGAGCRNGEAAGCTKMPFGMKLGLSPWDFVLDGDPAPLPKRGGAPPSPIFGPFLL